jgi:hypothetical protein
MFFDQKQSFFLVFLPANRALPYLKKNPFHLKGKSFPPQRKVLYPSKESPLPLKGKSFTPQRNLLVFRAKVHFGVFTPKKDLISTVLTFIQKFFVLSYFKLL